MSKVHHRAEQAAFVQKPNLDSHYHALAAVRDPDQLGQLLAVSCALARAHGGRVTLLSVTADGERPDWLIVPEDTGGPPIEVVVSQGESANDAILAAVLKHPPDLLLLGWRGTPGQGQYLLGSTLDPVLRQAACDMAVVRFGGDSAAALETLTAEPDSLAGIKRVLIPMAGGPNATLAMDMALSLAPDVQVTALNIAPMSEGRAGVQLGRERLEAVLAPWAGDERVQPKVVQAPGIIGGILSEARRGYDLLLIGASHESVIDRMLFGNVPQRVALASPVPAIVTKRRVERLDSIWLRTRQRLFDLLPKLTLDERVSVYREVQQGAQPNVDFFLMIGLSAAIAALGLLLDSPAVIIGAMLVAPLMSAIVGLGLGVVQGDLRLLRLSAGAILRGVTLAVAVGGLMALVVPGAEPTREVLARTRPTLLDLGIALASGAAGAYALCRKNVSSSLPGVSIAAALVPPLAVVGIGLTLMDGTIAGGALLLFITNLIAIASAGGLLFLWLGFQPRSSQHRETQVFKGGVTGAIVLLLFVTLPLGLLTAQSLREAGLNRTLQEVLEEEVAAMGRVKLLDWQFTDPIAAEPATGDDLSPELGGMQVAVPSDGEPSADISEPLVAGNPSNESETLRLEVQVRATRQVSNWEVIDLQVRVATRLQRPVALQLIVIPTVQLDPFVPPTLTPTATFTPTLDPTTTATATATASATPTTTPTTTPTPTPTPTSTPTTTPTPTSTPTTTPTPTSTPTHTPTPTSTPVAAVISNTNRRGVYLRQAPGLNGEIIGALSEGDRVEILYQQEVVGGLEWVQIRDGQGRVAWVVSRFLQPQPRQ